MVGRELRVEWRGRVPYRQALEEQRRAVAERALGHGCDQLWLLEHDPVVTLGRASRGDAPAIPGVDVVAVERGGKATFHGPGQLVGYPILALAPGERDLHAYLRRVEEALRLALGEFGLEGRREVGATGIWVTRGSDVKKVASIGVAVKQWVTFHGFALNVSTDLRGFEGFEPCGFSPGVMTSLEECLGRRVGMREAVDPVSRAFLRVFEARPIEAASIP